MSDDGVHILGIRHHGPGSAKSLCAALEELRPDVILVEGPPDAQDIIALAGRAEMQPPVALLVYVPDDPQKSAFYPFAVYSPEWQALQYGLGHGVEIRFMDLPQSIILALEEEKKEADSEEASEPAEEKGPPNAEFCVRDPKTVLRRDPIGYLAEAAGFADGERWWEHMFEARQRSSSEVFSAILESMTALRQELRDEFPADVHEQRREAQMRRTLRQARKDGFERIAVVCGAWHGPALAQMPSAKTDQELLSGLPKVKTRAAWAPWSYSRISCWTGYGAGVRAPEWYHMLWAEKAHLVTHWMTRAARLMRAQQLDTSSAHVIESVRLAEALAALRHRPTPSLEEMDEAALTVMCSGEEAPMRLIRAQLIVGDRLGQIPEDAPIVPLQEDLTGLQKRLRLPVQEDSKEYDFDLRQSIDLERSHLLHRLSLLGIPWGCPSSQGGRKAGTFHEYWTLQWKPEFVLDLIQAARWGNTVENAASAKCRHTAENSQNIKDVAVLLDSALLANLPAAVEALVAALQERTAHSGDVQQMMEAIVPVAGAWRYGNVRQTDKTMLAGVIEALAARIFINLPGACASLNDEAAERMIEQINATHSAITLLEQEALLDGWTSVLNQLAELKTGHHLIGGRCCRLLHELGRIEDAEIAQRMSLALSSANESAQAAAWLEGFLRGGGAILIHDRQLYAVLDHWICDLKEDRFLEVLPLLRRTFSTFSLPERRHIGDQAKKTGAGPRERDRTAAEAFNAERGARVLPLLRKILQVEIES
jgi:hypothetical protein